MKVLRTSTAVVLIMLTVLLVTSIRSCQQNLKGVDLVETSRA